MKKSFIFLITLTVFLSMFAPLTCFATYNDSLDIDADIAYMVCLDNDEAIFNKNFDKVTAPASLTKIMVALIALEKCDNLSAPVTVSQYALDSLIGTDSSTSGLKPGEKVTMEILLNCMLVKSANEAAIAIAEYIGGSIPNFVNMMNAKAKELGCKNTNYVNVHGLDADGHYTTAKDLYIITKEALKNPTFEKIVGKTEYTIPKTNMQDERTVYTTNFMLNSNYNFYYLPYITGVKTGTTDDAGHCIITKASKNGYNYLAIIMGADERDINNDGEKENIAFMQCKKMIEWTYNNIKYKVVAEANQIVTVAKVKYSWETDHVNLIPGEDISALVPSRLDSSSVYIQPNTDTPETLKAPIKKGDIVGTATIYYAGSEIAVTNLVAQENVRRSLILSVGGIIGAIFSSVIGKILITLIILTVTGYIGYIVYLNKFKNSKTSLKDLFKK